MYSQDMGSPKISIQSATRRTYSSWTDWNIPISQVDSPKYLSHPDCRFMKKQVNFKTSCIQLNAGLCVQKWLHDWLNLRYHTITKDYKPTIYTSCKRVVHFWTHSVIIKATCDLSGSFIYSPSCHSASAYHICWDTLASFIVDIYRYL
jgi:hypothetical protein